MKAAGAIVALIAGVFGVMAAIFTLAFGGVASAFGAQGSSTVVWLGWGGLLFSFAVIVAGATIFAKPKPAGITVIVCSIAGMILGGTFVAIAMLLSLVGGILGVVASRSAPVIASTPRDASVAAPPVTPVPDRPRRAGWLWPAAAVALVGIVVVIAASNVPRTPSPEPLAALTAEAPSDLRPDGELAALFALGSKNTDLQRETKLKEITGQLVEWRLPVYEVSRSGDGYKIQTQSRGGLLTGHSDLVGTFIYITARNEDEKRLIEQLKTDDLVAFRGRIAGSSIRHLEIRPATLALTPADPQQVATAPAAQPSAPATPNPLVPAPSFTAPEEDPTEKSGPCKGLNLSITSEQSECLSRRFKIADDNLNHVYKELSGRLADAQKPTLRDSQRAWLKEKQSKCEHAGDEVKGGTLEPIAVADCNVQMTEERATYLLSYAPAPEQPRPILAKPQPLPVRQAPATTRHDDGIADAANEMLREGEACMETKNYSCAITSANNALRLVPTSTRAAQLRDRAQQAQKTALGNIKFD